MSKASRSPLLWPCLALILSTPLATPVLSKELSELPPPASRSQRMIQGWKVLVDDRLLAKPNEEMGTRVLAMLEAKLVDITYVVPAEPLAKLRAVTIVLDLSHGPLHNMQYHPGADWLVENGYSPDLVKCVHIPEAKDLLSSRCINEQPWVILHELAHAYHDQVLGFEEPRVMQAFEAYRKSGNGDNTLLYNGKRVRHYALTDQKEFFAEMTESYLGVDDFFPFNAAELLTAEPAIFELMRAIWGPLAFDPLKKSCKRGPVSQKTSAYTLWYDKPAQKWAEALPVGNGRLGAMMFGEPGLERLQLNEDTLWSGQPYDPTRPGGPEALPEIRKLVFEGKWIEAEALFAKKMMGKPDQMKYQPLGELLLAFPGHAKVTDYARVLNLETAIASVSYKVDGVTYKREVFANAIDQVIVVRLTADKPNSISFNTMLCGITDPAKPGDEEFQTKVLKEGELVLSGKAASYCDIKGAVRYQGRARVIPEGGKLTTTKDKVIVQGANSAMLVMVAATNFKRYDDLSADPEDRAKGYMSWVGARTYDRLYTRHLASHQELFGRSSLNLPASEASTRPTDERLRLYDPEKDPQLMALMYQYGRYLLLGSSRPGTQPANLQGVWNADMEPKWDSKYTANINVQMNYWPAEATSLQECVDPLVVMVRELSETGTKVAKVHYNASGWVFHQNTDIWRAAAPMDGPTWGTFTVGGAWLCTHLWERYLFSRDKEFLESAYPLFKGSAQFFLDTLVEHPKHKWLVTCPANSPESFPASPGNHSFYDEYCKFPQPGTTICAGPTMDMGILRDLFEACIESARVLKVDEEFTKKLVEVRGRLAPMQIGKKGNLQEWLGDWGDIEKQHRHISHLYAVYPSAQITPRKTPELAEAAKVSLNMRGDGGTGFGMAWKAACWARLLDGEHANVCLANLVAKQTCPNLFSICFSTPQVEGAMGATAAMAEMLLQSHEGELNLLPALPKAWHTGEVSGLRARGGFSVNQVWAKGSLVSATITSSLGGPCVVRYPARLRVITQNGAPVASESKEDGLLRFESKANGVYILTP